LMENPSLRRLLCIQADLCRSLFTITAAGEDHCHQILNQHPCLVLDACFEGEEFIDSSSHFVVPYGQRVALGRSSASWQARTRLILVLGDTLHCAHAKRLYVDLDRCNKYQVEVSEEFPTCAAIRVELRNRVALVTVTQLVVMPELVWAVNLQVLIQYITVSVVGEDPRAEAVACTLSGVSLTMKQSVAGQRETLCALAGVQVDVYHPKPQVVLASVGPKAVSFRILREDIARGDVVIRSASIEPGSLELHVFEELVGLAKSLAAVMTPRPLGLEFDAAVSRAGIPYNLVYGAHQPSQKYVFHEINVGGVQVGVWCKVSLAILPDLVGLLMKLSSFSPMLEVDGARMNLQPQRFFTGHGAFEGSLETLGSLLWRRYKPCLRDSWRSLLNNSNAVLGGLLGRHAWAPRRRRVDVPRRPQLRVVNSVVAEPQQRKLAGDAWETAGAGLKPSIAAVGSRGSCAGPGSVAELHEEGYERVAATRSQAEMMDFIVRVVSSLGTTVADEMKLQTLAVRHCSENGCETFLHLVAELSDPHF